MILYIKDIDWKFVQEEVQFLNHLMIQNKSIQMSYFSHIGGEKTAHNYFNYFSNRYIVFIPKKLDHVQWFDKIPIKHPDNLLQHKQYFKKYCELIEIKPICMWELDSILSQYFKADRAIISDKIIICYPFTSKTFNRYKQFQYLVEGIDNKMVQWDNCANKTPEEVFVHKLNKELSAINNKDINNIAFWYHAGTSAISPK